VKRTADRAGARARKKSATTRRARRKAEIAIKRVYEPAAADDGRRFLVERLWPRGVKKTALKIDAWLRDVAPGTALRKWFNHDPARWTEFQRRYRAELDAHPEAWAPLVDAAREGKVTLLFSSHDAEHNNVVALAAYLRPRLRRTRNGSG
jgi:uncharacterized protein YeaO (DUF488 family)